MQPYQIFYLIASAAIGIAFINERFGKLQNTIAITAVSTFFSLLTILLVKFHVITLSTEYLTLIKSINFGHFLLDGILGFLLFAGGLGIKLQHLRSQRLEIACLAIVSTLLSTVIIATLLWGLAVALQFKIDFLYCLVFGALISPTDPIAVIAILRKMKAPPRLGVQVEGESLFNDGVGLVLFTTILGVAFATSTPTFLSVSELFLTEALGGILFGALLGLIFHYLIAASLHISMQLLLTMLIPSAGYALANALEVSGPLAMVVAGIMIGNWTKKTRFNLEDSKFLLSFWALVDELLNNMLFLLIGTLMFGFTWHPETGILMLASIPMVLLGRYLSIKPVFLALSHKNTYNPYTIKVLTWGSLRGALALAMALSVPSKILPIGEHQIDIKEIIVLMTYSVVLFSILIQGTTIAPFIGKAKQTSLQATAPKPDRLASTSD